MTPKIVRRAQSTVTAALAPPRGDVNNELSTHAFIFAICIAILIRSRSIAIAGLLLAITVAYGAFLFPNINGIAEAINWRMNNSDGVMTYSFGTRIIEKDWSTPEYWLYLLNQVHMTYWWAAWPIHFCILYFIAYVIRPSRQPE